MIRFCSLGSGSTGNATVVEASGGITTTRLLVDAGFSLRELELRLARAGLEPGDLDAVFVTHEHSDHIGCAIAFAEKHRLAVWMSRGTWRAIGEQSIPERLGVVRDGESVALGDLELHPVTVAHDAAEPLQLRCRGSAASCATVNGCSSRSPSATDSPSRTKPSRSGIDCSPIARHVPRLIQTARRCFSANAIAQPM